MGVVVGGGNAKVKEKAGKKNKIKKEYGMALKHMEGAVL